ncbi:MAG: hypothetical protein ACE5GF_05420 [Thermodesulfobacteriota bacterium]
MKIQWKALFTVLFVVALALSGCGGGSSDDDTASTTTTPAIGDGGKSTYLGTQSPGDLWVWTIDRDAGTFSATNVTTGYTYSGTAAILSNGFLRLTIGATTDPGATVGGNAYALEVPNTVLLIKPSEADSNVIVAAAQGSCPTANASYNWISIPETAWVPATGVAYGTASSVVTGSDFAFTVARYLLDGTSLPGDTPSGSCSGGRIDLADGTVIGIAPSGMFIGDSGPGNGGFVGVEAPSANIDIADLTASGKEYRGVLFKYNDPDSDDTEPVWARGTGASTLAGGGYTDFEAGTEDTVNTVSIRSFTESSPGIYTAILTEPDGATATFVFMVSRINGKYVLVGISTNTHYTTLPYNALLVEQ